MGAVLSEVSLHCSDVTRSATFYRELVGLALEHQEPHEGDELEHWEAMWGEPGQPGFAMMILWAAGSSAVTTGATVGFSVPDVMEVHARAEAMGVRVLKAPREQPWGMGAEYEDPDGNIVYVSS